MLEASPRILVLYGSSRPQSASRKLAFNAMRALAARGVEARAYDPAALLRASGEEGYAHDPRLYELAAWSDGQVWCSPEHHASLSGVMKLVLDTLPPEATRGKALALMQISGGAICCNALNDMSRIARALGMYTTTRQVAVGNVAHAFDASDRLASAILRQRLDEAMEEVTALSRMLRERAAGAGGAANLSRVARA